MSNLPSMTSNNSQKPGLHSRCKIDKENSSYYANWSNEKKYSIPCKYRKPNEALSKPNPILQVQGPAKYCDSVISQNPPTKYYRKEGLSKRYDYNKAKKQSVFEKNPHSNNLKELIMCRNEDLGFMEKENERLCFPQAENFSEDENLKSIQRDTKKPLLIETIKTDCHQKSLNIVEELIIELDDEQEKATEEKPKVSEPKKQDEASIAYLRQQCNKTVEEYAQSIIQTLKEKDAPVYCLQKHKISSNLRAKMVDWMVEVMTSFKFSDQSFFLSVNIMDFYLEKTEKVHEVSDLHIVGVTSMFMATKYEEIYPLRLSAVHQKICHKKLNPEQIKEKEMEILLTLGYKLTNATLYEFLTNTLFQLNLKSILIPKLYNYFNKVCIYMAKTAVHDYDLISQQDYSELAASILYVTFKIMGQLEKGFPITGLMKRVKDILDVQEDIIMDCSTRLLTLAKNFDKVYPYLINLKKFHSFSLNDENKQH